MSQIEQYVSWTVMLVALALVTGCPKTVPEPSEPPAVVVQMLKKLASLETSYYAAHRKYTSDLEELGFEDPTQFAVYSYGFCVGDAKVLHTPLLSTSAAMSPCEVLEDLGLASDFAIAERTFRAFAIGNLDKDSDVELWSINQHGVIEQLRSD